ncbi:leucine-rich repeat-containing protein 58 [Arctopsyche grandis]|uniref:leucine-rich repeat-containing protein 58 n=1 Tax=Arctopsyche grandis TaxID=121162 RepID=UPI00406D8C30
MECYTSDSCDSDAREQKTLDLSGQQLDSSSAESALRERAHSEKKSSEQYEVMLLHCNRIAHFPDSVASFVNLRVLDISNNGLHTLPDILESCPLTSLIAKNNCLSNESLPKSFCNRGAELKELNLSGNLLTSFPDQLLDLPTIKYLYLGGNSISNVPRDVWKMTSLQVLALGGNKIIDVPDSVGQLKHLQMLVLSENNIEQLPASIGKLNHLRTLLLHKNRLRTLPTEIITLKCLTELSLRDNPLVVRFVRDISLQPPTLLELAARTVKLHEVRLQPGDIPHSLYEYLHNAHHCVNPKCKGVFFDSRVEHIKFVDFCGKYRLPLLQYLCSSKCIQNVGSWESRESDPVSRGYMMKKVLLG